MPNPVIHFEIGCRDRAQTESFFRKLFNWQMNDAGPATMINTGGAVTGHITALGHEPHDYTIFYVQVDDVQVYLEKAAGLGGKIPGAAHRHSNGHIRVVR